MIEKCSDVITDWLGRCDVIKDEDRELYKYASYSVLVSISPLVLAILVGYVMGAIKESLLIIVSFVVVRKFSGGYHANKASTCFWGSSLILVLCIILSLCIDCGWGLMLITTVSVVSLVCFSPIDNENRVLSKEEYDRNKRITIVIVLFFSLIDILLLINHLNKSVICISLGLVLTASLQWPSVLRKSINILTK